jgi:hypothetical protein
MDEGKRYRLKPGLQQTLRAVIGGSEVEDLFLRMKGQIEDGEIDYQTREILIALGWVTPRDPRVVALQRQVRKKREPDVVTERFVFKDKDEMLEHLEAEG